VSSLTSGHTDESFYTTAWPSSGQGEGLGADYVWTITPQESHPSTAVLAPQEGFNVPLWVAGTSITKLDIGRSSSWYDAHLVTGAEYLRNAYPVAGLLVDPGAEIRYARKLPARWLRTPSCTKLHTGWGLSGGYVFPAVQDVAKALHDLAEWTRLPIEDLGNLLGASRRSFYNWRAGKQASKDYRDRILQARNILEPVALTRDPVLVRHWINSGTPSPATLLREQRWHDLERAVTNATAPVRPALQPSNQDASAVMGEPEGYGPQAREALLAGFGSAKPRTLLKRDTWYPRELTDDSYSEGENEG
jgi:hypothetical protein